MSSIVKIALFVVLAAVAAGTWVWLQDEPAAPGAAPTAASAEAPASVAPGIAASVNSAGPVTTKTAPVREPPPASAAPDPHAQAVYAQLKSGPSAAACEAAQPEILELLGGAAVDSSLWRWGMGRARECLRATTPFRAKNSLLAALIERWPDHPLVRELAGLQQYDAGDLAGAAATLEDANKEGGSFESWETYADAQLARFKQQRAAGDPAWQDTLARAEAAARRAVELASPDTLPFAWHTLARAQLERGHADDAIASANAALEALRANNAKYQAFMTGQLYVYCGQIYWRAGQRDTGRAYMDQGVAMAPQEDQRAQLARVRDSFMAAYGG